MKIKKPLNKFNMDFINGRIISIVVGIFLIVMGIIFWIDDGEINILTAFILIFGIGDVVVGSLRLKYIKD